MNLGQGQAHESHFGPSSELVNISAFLKLATELSSPGESSTDPSNDRLEHAWRSLPPQQAAAISAECSVQDIKGSIEHVITDPRLMTHVSRTHQAIVQSIYETADSTPRRKRRRITLPEPAQEHVEVTALRAKMDSIELHSWPLSLHAASFIRPPKHSDRNTLVHAKRFGMPSGTTDGHDALVFVSIYNKLSWGHRQLYRSSQHVLLSSQSLGDLFEIIPCTSSEIPKEIVDDSDKVIGYEMPNHTANSTQEGSSGYVTCIDGVVYGDGLSVEDYAERLLKLQRTTQHDRDDRPPITRGPSMHDVPLTTLSFNLHKPYWFLHVGNCEHYFVIDEVRLRHAADPPTSAYPLTTQITPPLLDLCRACNKVPATLAITGDIRLSESPFVICGPCWRWMGEPNGSNAQDVMVVPLPKYEHGW